MAVYRFFFAPVLLAVAVLAGPRAPGHRAPAPLPRAAAAAPARLEPSPVVKASPVVLQAAPGRAVRADLPRVVATH